MKDALWPPQGYDPNQIVDLSFNKFVSFPPEGGKGMGGAVPTKVKELYEEVLGDFDNIIFDDGIETGDILVVQ